MPHRSESRLSYGSRQRNLITETREAHQVHVAADFQRRRIGSRLMHPTGPSRAQHPAVHGIAAQVHHSISTRIGNHPPASSPWYPVSPASVHRVEASPGTSRSVDSSDVQPTKEAETTQTTPHTTTHTTTTPKAEDLVNDKLRSVGSSEADAASALLFATTARFDTKQKTKAYTKEDEAHEVSSSTSQVPLKKRRKFMESTALDASVDAERPPIHVSPLSNNSIASHVEREPSQPTATTTPSSTGRTDSYDLREAQCLPESAKIKYVVEISPHSQTTPVTSHFPSVLHDVLTKSDFSERVIQWLPHGKAWKIIRWDALRRKVLPRYFPKLRDEDGKETGSIDAFLWNLRAWGFDEINDGPDVGAYSHPNFVRGIPEVCRQMKFSPKTSDDLHSPMSKKNKDDCTEVTKQKDCENKRSILRVPSLASRTQSSDSKPDSSERTHTWSEERELKSGGELVVRSMHSPNSPYHTVGWPSIRHSREVPVFVNYRSDEMAYAEGWHYYPESPHAMRTLTTYDPRLHTHQHQHLEVSRRSLPIHSSPRVQSGRGAIRLRASVSVGQREQIQSSSFPVSNRGKGQRSSPACRVHIPSADIARLSKVQSSLEQTPAAGSHFKDSNAKQITAKKEYDRSINLATESENHVAGV